MSDLETVTDMVLTYLERIDEKNQTVRDKHLRKTIALLYTMQHGEPYRTRARMCLRCGFTDVSRAKTMFDGFVEEGIIKMVSQNEWVWEGVPNKTVVDHDRLSHVSFSDQCFQCGKKIVDDTRQINFHSKSFCSRECKRKFEAEEIKFDADKSASR